MTRTSPPVSARRAVDSSGDMPRDEPDYSMNLIASEWISPVRPITPLPPLRRNPAAATLDDTCGDTQPRRSVIDRTPGDCVLHVTHCAANKSAAQSGHPRRSPPLQPRCAAHPLRYTTPHRPGELVNPHHPHSPEKRTHPHRPHNAVRAPANSPAGTTAHPTTASHPSPPARYSHPWTKPTTRPTGPGPSPRKRAHRRERPRSSRRRAHLQPSLRSSGDRAPLS